jgi:hypothetical protein
MHSTPIRYSSAFHSERCRDRQDAGSKSKRPVRVCSQANPARHPPLPEHGVKVSIRRPATVASVSRGRSAA